MSVISTRRTNKKTMILRREGMWLSGLEHRTMDLATWVKIQFEVLSRFFPIPLSMGIKAKKQNFTSE